MTCISAVKSPIVLKWYQMVAMVILYHPVLQYLSYLIFCLKNMNKLFEFSEKIQKNNGGIRRKTHISWLLKDLESYNWYQMIARTMFYDHVISNI